MWYSLLLVPHHAFPFSFSLAFSFYIYSISHGKVVTYIVPTVYFDIVSKRMGLRHSGKTTRFAGETILACVVLINQLRYLPHRVLSVNVDPNCVYQMFLSYGCCCQGIFPPMSVSISLPHLLTLAIISL